MASANREGRRRRVLREDSQSAESGSKSRSRKKTKPYSDAALIELQPRITDLIPTRLWGLIVLLLFGIASAAIIQTVYHIRVSRMSHVDYQIVSGMNLYGPGTIISWLSSVYLLMAGGAALLVYNTRRHKIDDYFGRYGLWIWMAAACVLASLDATTGLHRVAQYALMKATGTAMWGDGSIWWISVYALLGLVVGGRALIDMWPCRGAFFLVLATGCYALATTIYLGVYRPNFGAHNMTLHSSTMLLGHFFVLYSFLLYARYVHRVAQGLVGKRGSKKKAGWWARQKERLAHAREERAAARLLRANTKVEQAAAREAAKEQKVLDRQAAKAKQVAERAEAKARKTAEREAANAEARNKKANARDKAARDKAARDKAARDKAARDKAIAQQKADQAAKKKQSPQKRNQAAAPTAKRSAPIDVSSVRAKKSSQKPVAVTVSHDDDTADMTVEELEMELLTNPNLSKTERRKLRKQLKDQQSRQRQAA